MHTQAISAAMAALTFRGVAILLMVTHLSLSTLSVTTPHPLLPLSLKLPSQTSCCLHVAESLRLSNIFLRPCAPMSTQMISMFELSLFEIGMATSCFHHECHVFGTGPIFPSSGKIRH